MINMGDETNCSGTGAIKRKREEKRLKRDHRSWENIMKSLSDLPDIEKLQTLSEKYNELYSELRKTNSNMQLMDKQLNLLQKEKDHTQSELTKNILAKTKLESLCREFQKQNKFIKDENLTRVKEEEEKRREVASNFTEKLNALTSLMDENKDKSVRLREENMSMTAKLTELYEQFRERETHLTNMNHQMELQKKLYEARITKLEIEYQNERQLWEKERHIILDNLDKSKETNSVLQENVESLQTHIEVYKGQYSDFENTMQKSNKVFDAFKEELEKMQKTNTALEMERNEWRSRWQSVTNSLVNVSEVHQQSCKDLKAYEKKVAMLEKLCRQLQTDRVTYIQQLKENNIVPLQVIRDELPSPDAIVPQHIRQTPMTRKERELLALKEELKFMENQLKESTAKLENTEQNFEAEETQPEICPDTSRNLDNNHQSDQLTTTNYEGLKHILKNMNNLTEQMGTVCLHLNANDSQIECNKINTNDSEIYKSAQEPTNTGENNLLSVSSNES